MLPRLQPPAARRLAGAAAMLLAWASCSPALAQASGAVGPIVDDSGQAASGVQVSSHGADGQNPAGAPTTLSTLIVTGKGRMDGPGVSQTGANGYAVEAQDIADLPAGPTSPMTDVLAQMPGVAIDQNQQIHIRDTEGPQFQYQINGVLVPLDINTNPPFLSMINPQFVRQLVLLDGVLPSRYSYATGGVVDIRTKDGCDAPGGEFTITVGQRQTVEPSAQLGGCVGKFGYYVSGLYDEGETAFSSATPGPNPIHDYTNQGQGFGFFSYQLGPSTRLSLTLSAAASRNQLPNVAGLTPFYTLAGAPAFPSADINSYLDFQDYLAIVALNGSAGAITYQLAYSAHYISEDFRPDDAGELIYQGVASRVSHDDVDNTLEGDVTFQSGRHTLGAGFYVGDYQVTVNDSSLVFPVFFLGQPRGGASSISAQGGPVTGPPEPTGPLPQSSTTPILVLTNTAATNLVLGLYVDDLWRITDRLRADIGFRVDSLTGFTNHSQVDPSINLTYRAGEAATVHAGYARYMQVPSFQGIAPGAAAAFLGTTGTSGQGISTPMTEDDEAWDAGLVWRISPRLTVSEDDYYELTDHYLDTGEFGVVPLFAPFNYDHGHVWGSELAVKYQAGDLSAYANLTLGRNWQKGVATGQFNFEPNELEFIDANGLILDHQPLVGVSAGGTWRVKGFKISLDAVYSSGLRGGFADQTQLPNVVQVNGAVEHTFHVRGLGALTDRLSVVNLFDRINLIRPAEGIGIFQSAYGPRFTVTDSLSVAF